MAVSAIVLRRLRLLHLYVGVFTAPALLFFAMTGAVQTAGFHEAIPGTSYQPPHWIAVLAQIHKKQTAVLPSPRRSEPPREKAEGSQQTSEKPFRPPQAPTAQRSPIPMKVFFLLVCVGLFASTLSGVWMSYVYDRNRRLITALLLLGVVVPIALVFV